MSATTQVFWANEAADANTMRREETKDLKRLLSEITFQQTSKACTMASLVLSHFVYGIVDGIESSGLGILGNAELIFASTSLSSSTLLEVSLGVPYTLTKQFCKTTGMVSLLKGITLEGFCYLGITLAISLTGHGQIHTDFTTLTVKMIAEILNHFFADTLGLAITNAMNSSISGLAIIFQLRELRCRSLTDRTLLGCLSAFVDISTNGANKLLLHSVFVLK